MNTAENTSTNNPTKKNEAGFNINILQSLCEKSRVPQSDVEKVLVNLSGCILGQDSAVDIETLLTKNKDQLDTYNLNSAISAVTQIPRPTVVAVTKAMMEVIEQVLRPENNFCGQKVIVGNAIEIQSSMKNSRSTLGEKNKKYLSVKVSTTSLFKKKMK